MYVALSKFVVASGHAEAVAEGFRNRPHVVDQVAGFVRLEVLRPTDLPEEFWLFTYWDDAAAFMTWHRSPAFKAAHADLPAGLKLVPGANQLLSFEVLAQ